MDTIFSTNRRSYFHEDNPLDTECESQPLLQGMYIMKALYKLRTQSVKDSHAATYLHEYEMYSAISKR